MRSSLPILALLTLCACAPRPHNVEHDWPSLPGPFQSVASGTPEVSGQTNTLLGSAYHWIEPVHIDKAEALLTQIQPQSVAEKATLQIVEAKKALFYGKPSVAEAHLSALDPNDLIDPWRFYYYDLRAMVFAKLQNPNASLKAHLNALEALPATAHKTYAKRIAVTLHQSSAITPHAFPTDMQWQAQGFLQFNWLGKQSFFTPFAPNYDTWKARFDHHPLTPLLQPTSALTWPKAPLRIGVLLPESGPYAKATDAIRTGMLAAYYQHASTLKPAPNIDWINTSAGPITTKLASLQANYDVLIGPLTKDAIASVCHYDGKLPPTLALNAPTSGTCEHPNVHIWHVSPQSELPGAKTLLETLGAQNIMVVSTEDYHDLATAFSNQWQQDHPSPIRLKLPADQKERADKIKQMLQVDASEARYQTLQHYIQGDVMRFMATRRQDIDGVFLAMSEKEAKQIVPLLQYYFIGNLPLVGTSLLQPKNSQHLSHDLYQVHWPGSRFLTENTTPIPALQAVAEQLQQEASEHYVHNKRLLALGVDGLWLALSLHTLQQNPSHPYPGLSDDLSVDDNGDIIRLLRWYKNQQGHVHFVAPKRWQPL